MVGVHLVHSTPSLIDIEQNVLMINADKTRVFRKMGHANNADKELDHRVMGIHAKQTHVSQV